MTDQLLVDIDQLARVSVRARHGDVVSDVAGAPFELQWPLERGDLEELRWYLEDYLRAPYGADGARGLRIAEALRHWGRSVFASVFGAGAAHDAYLRARAGCVPLEVVIRSSSTGVLGLPWELMRDPERQSPVALDLVGISRALSGEPLREPVAVESDVLRVLMVISRPAGRRDVGYRMVARPLVQRLQAVRGDVELTVLRPPTFAALRQALSSARAAGAPFQIVHFDGHGALAGGRATRGVGPIWLNSNGGEAMLAFEKPTGGSDPVGAAAVSRVLSEARVRLVVLNACQSGAVGKELEAAVATRLLQEGVPSVVAMAYSVYAVAAADFMGAFYERLFIGESVTQAVTAGRRHLFEHCLRPSPRGDLELADWVIPVHYRRHDLCFPQLASRRVARRRDTSDALGPVEPFVGRDLQFHELEAAFRTRRVVLLHGPGGVGKTELAKAFARWRRDTGGVDNRNHVVLVSFEPGTASVGLGHVLASIGVQVLGTDFLRVEPDQRESLILSVVRENALILVWDGLECVYTMSPTGSAIPPLSALERDGLRSFARAIADGASSVLLVTSRTTEAWLGDEVARIPVWAMTSDDAVLYASTLLAAHPSARQRQADPEFGQLLEMLDGHPLAMRLVMPHVRTTDPSELLAMLRGNARPTGLVTADQASLESCVRYSFDHLDPGVQRLLVVVSLFHGVADVGVLTALSQVEFAPDRFANVDRERWVQVLDAAAAVGLLTSLGAWMYRIHPAMTAFLADRWREDAPHRHDLERTQTSRALLSAFAIVGRWVSDEMRQGDADLAGAVIWFQRRTMGHLLTEAIESGLWEEAAAIAQPLQNYFQKRSLVDEILDLANRVRTATEAADGTPPDTGTSEGNLWLLVFTMQAAGLVQQGRLADAERMYLQLRDVLERDVGSANHRSRLSGVYHHLGNIAHKQRRLDEAETFLRQALSTDEALQDRHGIATACHELGIVAHLRGSINDAEGWYRRALTISQDLNAHAATAASYYQLGIVAQVRGCLDDAYGYYRRALAIYKTLDDQYGIAGTYHQLGLLEECRGRLDQAEEWYRASLTISEELDDRAGKASAYTRLGDIACDRSRLDDAEGWYERALALLDALDDRVGMGEVHHLLGSVALKRRNFDEAEEHYRQCLSSKEAIGDRPGMAITYHQLGMVAQFRGQLDDAERWYRDSLVIKRDRHNHRGMATSYHQLGVVSEIRGRLDEAEDWCRRALTICEELDDREGMALGYGTLGLLAEARDEHAIALEWTVRCVALFEEFPHPSTGPGPMHLARLTTKLGLEALDSSWQVVTGKPVPAALRDHLSPSAARDDPNAE